MSTKILLLCFIFGCVTSALAAGWEGTFSSSRHGGLIHICGSGDSYRGSFDGIGMITSITRASSTELEGNYIEAGVEENAGTFVFRAIHGDISQGFTGYYQVNGREDQASWSGQRLSRFNPGADACMLPADAENDLSSHWSIRSDVADEESQTQMLDICTATAEQTWLPESFGSGDRDPDHFWYLEGEFLDEKKHWVGNVWYGINLEGNWDNDDRIHAGIGLARQLDNATMHFTFWRTGQDFDSRAAINAGTPVTTMEWKRYSNYVNPKNGEADETPEYCRRNKGLSQDDFQFPAAVISAASSVHIAFFAVVSVFAAIFSLSF